MDGECSAQLVLFALLPILLFAIYSQVGEMSAGGMIGIAILVLVIILLLGRK